MPLSQVPGRLLLVVFVSLALPLPVVGQDGTGSLPSCDPLAPAPSGCVLPTWPTAGPAALPSRFGTIEPIAWVDDPTGDAPAGGLDILGVGIADVEVSGSGALRRADDVLRLGGRRKAVRDGSALLVRAVLATPVDALADGSHAGVFVATDIDGVRSNDAPTSVDAPDVPFAGLQEVYSFNVVAGEEPTLLFSDLSRGWYKGRQPFVGHRPAAEVVDLLVRPEAFGETLRLVTFASGDAGGYDVAGVGPVLAPIPVDGVVGTTPSCLEGAVAVGPFRVARLIENGETFRDIETPRSWSAVARFALEDAERAALDGWIRSADPDGDGRRDLEGSVVLVEEGLNVRQVPQLSVGSDAGEAVLAIRVGLARRGFIVVRDLEIAPTGDAVMDAFLVRAADGLVTALPPFRVAGKGGPVLASPSGPCLAEPSPEAA